MPEKFGERLRKKKRQMEEAEDREDEEEIQQTRNRFEKEYSKMYGLLEITQFDGVDIEKAVIRKRKATERKRKERERKKALKASINQ